MSNSTQLVLEKVLFDPPMRAGFRGYPVCASGDTRPSLPYCELTEMAICLSYKSPNCRLLQAINRIYIDLLCPVRLREAPLLLVPFFASNSLFVTRNPVKFT